MDHRVFEASLDLLFRHAHHISPDRRNSAVVDAILLRISGDVKYAMITKLNSTLTGLNVT